MNIVFLLNQEIYESKTSEILNFVKQASCYKNLNPSKIIFCLSKENIKSFDANQNTEKLIFAEVCGPTSGSVCAALLASEYIDNAEELVLIDELIKFDFVESIEYFDSKKYDAGVVSFYSSNPHHSCVKLDENGNVYEVEEKNSISDNSLGSFYYYRNGSDFIKCAKNVIRKDNKINDGFYLSQTINEMVLLHKQVGFYHFGNNSLLSKENDNHEN